MVIGVISLVGTVLSVAGVWFTTGLRTTFQRCSIRRPSGWRWRWQHNDISTCVTASSPNASAPSTTSSRQEV